MGTSTLRSYRAAQIFEAVGLGKEVIDLFFTGTPSRIGGIGLEEIGEEAIRKHEAAWNSNVNMLQSEGNFRYRKGGERHAWNPDSVRLLQWAVRSGSYERYREFADLSNNLNRNPHVIRGLFDFRKCTPIPLEQVEPLRISTNV
jgi:glutamate synthase (NADPH/NADH) large chain